MNSDSNRKRVFADVVTIDAWHDIFSSKKKSVDLHADVGFDKARVGGESESPVRFRLSLKRAELIVVIAETEPVIIDRASVAREYNEKKTKSKSKISSKQEAEIKGALNVSTDIQSPGASASLSAGRKAKVTIDRSNESSETIIPMKIKQSQTSEGFYRWIFEERNGESLIGKPWDAQKKPRLRLIDKRSGTRGLPPVVRLELRCKREDLIIENIEIKNEKLWDKLKSEIGFANKMIAVEAYIRNRLIEEGLEVGEISDKFAQITMGSVIASEGQ